VPGEPFPGGTDPAQSRKLASEARAELHRHISGWLGERELSRADFAASVACTRNGSGEPLWGMVIDVASGGKTEIIRMAGNVADGSLDEFTAASLLSFSKVAKNPQPVGVLIRIPAKALLTIADFSTVLASSDRGLRDQLFSDLRRVYDGQLNRDLGNMPRGLSWSGRVTMLAASTPAVDDFASHSDRLGPRWLFHRGKSSKTATRREGAAKRMTEKQLEANRAKARELFTRVVTHGQAAYPAIELPEDEDAALGDIAVAATLCRSPVPRGGYGRREITGLPDTEEPYRLAAQLRALARGAMAIGCSAQEAVALARRCAMDTVPPVRVRMLWVLAHAAEGLTAASAGRAAEVDRKVARRALEDLRALGIITCPVEESTNDEDTTGVIWVADQTDDGKKFMKRIPKVWMYAYIQDPEIQERVELVRQTVLSLSASAGGVPKSEVKPPHPPNKRETTPFSERPDDILNNNNQHQDDFDWGAMYKRATEA
jgi:hypothetical protein